jgi:L-threonylcarbamoyladenylate synthase
VRLVSWPEAAKRLAGGEVGVIPTDTLYGIVGSARRRSTVEKIYALRQREQDKPMIVLAGELADIASLQIEVDDRIKYLLSKVWPGPVSVVLPAQLPALAYLHRGTNSIAFRVPAKSELRRLLAETGPLVAPSANLAGEPPALTIPEAQQYFGDAVFYLDEGKLENPASALVDGRTDPPRVLRPAPGFRIE